MDSQNELVEYLTTESEKLGFGDFKQYLSDINFEVFSLILKLYQAPPVNILQKDTAFYWIHNYVLSHIKHLPPMLKTI